MRAAPLAREHPIDVLSRDARGCCQLPNPLEARRPAPAAFRLAFRGLLRQHALKKTAFLKNGQAVFLKKDLRVHELIFANGRTLTEAARLIGCGTSTLGNYVNGETKAGPGLIKKLARFLKCLEADVPRKLQKQPDSLALRETKGAIPDLSWMLADYAERTVIEKMNHQLLDTTLPLDERMRRAGIFWGELERRVRTAASAARAKGRAADVVEKKLFDLKKRNPEVPR